MSCFEAQYQQSHSERWSEENVTEAIRVWDLNSEDEAELRSFKNRLSDKEVDHFKNTPHGLVYFMKGPKGPDVAEEMFRGMIAWRKTSHEKIDTMLDDYQPPRALYEYAASGLLEGVDKMGDPVYLERAGDMDGFGLCQRYEPDVLLKSVVWRRELTSTGAWIDEYKNKHGHLPRQLTVVYDLKGLSSRHMKKGVGAFFKEAVSYTADKYYGVSKRMIIIRPPTIFRMVWRVVQSFFHPAVRDKIVFADKDYMKTLHLYMDRSILPPSVYAPGTGTAARGFPPKFEGGLVPVDFQDSSYSSFEKRPRTATSDSSGGTVRTFRSGASGSSLSSDDDDDQPQQQQQHEQPPKLQRDVGVLSRSLLQGSLMLSKCGTVFELDIESVQSVQNLQESFC